MDPGRRAARRALGAAAVAAERGVREARWDGAGGRGARRLRARRLRPRTGEACGGHRHRSEVPLAIGRPRRARRRGHRGARRLDAVHRSASTRQDAGVPRRRAAARRRASRRRGRRHRRLAQVRRRSRRSARRRRGRGPLWRVGRLRARCSSTSASPSSASPRRFAQSLRSDGNRRDPAGASRRRGSDRPRAHRRLARNLPRTIPTPTSTPCRSTRTRDCGGRILATGSPKAGVFVAEDAGEVVGFASGNQRDPPKLDFRRGALGHLRPRRPQAAGNRPAPGGSGCRDHARETRRRLLVFVIAGNKDARAFYENMGAGLLLEQPFEWDGIR